jgi:hypothetical protein
VREGERLGKGGRERKVYSKREILRYGGLWRERGTKI